MASASRPTESLHQSTGERYHRMSKVLAALKQSPSLAVLAGLSLAGTAIALVLLALGHVAAALVCLLITIQLLLLGVVHVVSVNYRRQEKRARTWGVRHGAGQSQLAQLISTQGTVVRQQDKGDVSTHSAQLAEIQDAVDELLVRIRSLSVELADQRDAQQAEQRRAAFREVFGDGA